MLAAMGRALPVFGALTVWLSAVCAGAADLDLNRVAGLYVSTFMNGDIAGDKYWSDDVLEIVKVSRSTAYFRTYLSFFNGHECSLSGVAQVAGQSLVYADPKIQCELRLDVANGKITFADKDGACRQWNCGMRGMFNGEKFKLSSRRRITYMAKLLASVQYLDAVKEYQARHSQ
jgi:hypothetical protein